MVKEIAKVVLSSSGMASSAFMMRSRSSSLMIPVNPTQIAVSLPSVSVVSTVRCTGSTIRLNSPRRNAVTISTWLLRAISSRLSSLPAFT